MPVALGISPSCYKCLHECILKLPISFSYGMSLLQCSFYHPPSYCSSAYIIKRSSISRDLALGLAACTIGQALIVSRLIIWRLIPLRLIISKLIVHLLHISGIASGGCFNPPIFTTAGGTVARWPGMNNTKLNASAAAITLCIACRFTLPQLACTWA